MTSDWRAQVLEDVDRQSEEMLALLAALVRVPSVGGTDAENDCQALLADHFERDGLEVDYWQIPLGDLVAEDGFPGMEVDRSEAWGLVARLPGRGGGSSLMLNGHVDVVPVGALESWSEAPFSAAVRGGQLFGRGTCDMKAGLLASYWAVRALRRTGVPLRGDVVLASVQGEEDGGLGTYALLRRGWRADACVIPEPTSLDLVPANAGSLTFRLRVPGHATHASRRSAGVSAVEKFWPVFAALGALETRRNASVDPLFARWDIPYPLSIGIVHSGDWASSVPDLLVAEGRLGVALGEPAAAARAALEEAVADVCAADPWLSAHPVVVEWWGGQFDSASLRADSDLPARVGAAHAGVTGGSRQATWGAPYGSDLRLMTAGGVPTVHYGPGDVTLAHGPDESVPIEEVLTCARSLAVVALDLCGDGSPGDDLG